VTAVVPEQRTGRGLPSNWSSLVAGHSEAVDQYLAAATRVPSSAWTQPLATGKWSPAEITSHLEQSYQVLQSELSGRPGMRVILPPFRRWLVRLTIMPRILSGGPFPAGARAPRETRPREGEANMGRALSSLSEKAELLIRELTDQVPYRRVRLTHAYFGPLCPEDGLRLLTVHTRHHARQLEALVGPGASSRP
jgi:hypothetical protein